MTKAAVVGLGILALLLIAAVPDGLVVQEDRVVFRPVVMAEDIGGYLHGIVTGEAFTYQEHWHTRSFLPQAGDRAVRSFVYLGLSALAAVTVGLLTGLWLTAHRKEGIREALTSMAAVPDFVLALVLQIGVVAVYQWSGYRVARVVSLTDAEPAVLLPLLTLTLVPGISVLRTVSARAHMAAAADHTLVAKALGMSRRRIYLTRLTPLVLGFVRADIPRLAGTMLGNLFIVEYLFNIRGVTTFVFTRGLSGGYQYDLVMSALLLIAGLYAAVYLVLRLYLGALEGAVTRL
ncbi:MAG: ABC transporter permease subunit [Thermoleophilia bacterium]